MKKIKPIAALILVVCLLATMLPSMAFVMAVSQADGEAVLTQVAVVTPPAKTEYWAGEALDTTGLVLLASYSDGSAREITEGFTLSGFDSKVTGKQTVTVTYLGKSAQFTVEVNALKVTAITIDTLPIKTEYWTGEALDTTGLTVAVFYSDSNMEQITEGFAVSGFHSTVPGKQTLTVSYMGATDTFTVTVKKSEITGIGLRKHPDKTEYWTGEALDTTGLVLLVSYSDGSVVEITDGFVVTGFQSAVEGVQTLTVSYMGATDTFTVAVKQPKVIGIDVISQPAKTVYWTGEALDTTGLVLLATYLGGTTSQITEGFTVTGFDSALAGAQTLLVLYGDAIAEFTVTVNKLEVTGIEVVSLPAKTEYWIGEELDTTGLVLEVAFSDGRILRTTEGYTVSGFNSATAGQKNVRVYYQDYKDMFAVFSVTVKKPSVLAVKIKTLPHKTEYFVGEELDLTGLTLTATFSDGSTAIVSSGFTPMSFTSAAVGTKTVMVYYITMTKFVKITVTVKERCTHSSVENGVCTQCSETMAATVTDGSGNVIGNYVDMADALDAAVSGSTVALLSDTAVQDLRLPADAKLDLNGCVLTVETVLTYGNSAITDSSPENTGVLKITDPDGNMISPKNRYLPVYDSAKGGYRFFSVQVTPKAITGDQKYWFRVEIENFEEFYQLIQSGAEVQFQVKMTWEGQTQEVYATAAVAFTKAWAERYHANQSVYITVSVENAEGFAGFKLSPGIISGGVEIFGEEM